MSLGREVSVMSGDGVADVCRFADVGKGVSLILLHLMVTIQRCPIYLPEQD